jgi:hypothetical protein
MIHPYLDYDFHPEDIAQLPEAIAELKHLSEIFGEYVYSGYYTESLLTDEQRTLINTNFPALKAKDAQKPFSVHIVFWTVHVLCNKFVAWAKLNGGLYDHAVYKYSDKSQKFRLGFTRKGFELGSSPAGEYSGEKWQHFVTYIDGHSMNISHYKMFDQADAAHNLIMQQPEFRFRDYGDTLTDVEIAKKLADLPITIHRMRFVKESGHCTLMRILPHIFTLSDEAQKIAIASIIPKCTEHAKEILSTASYSYYLNDSIYKDKNGLLSLLHRYGVIADE